MENKIILDNKYIIIMKEGKGGTSEVFLVQEEETKKIYAAKILYHHYPFFENEIEMLKTLKDKNIPYIANLIDSGDGEIQAEKKFTKKQYLILEYAQKGDLSKYILLYEKGLKEKNAKLFFSKILKGVQAMHNNGICHRDLKTSNILLDEKYNPKICDFGFATYNTKNLKDCLGTKRYAAPEILNHQNYDGFKTDIFSLGVILFDLVTGLTTFREAKYEDHFYKYIKDKRFEQFWNKCSQVKGVSKEFKNLYFKMVSYMPNDRPSSIEDILNDDWFKEIKDIEKDEKKLSELELQIYEDFLERENIIKDLIKKRMNAEGNNNNENNRSSGEDYIEYFNNDLIIQKIKKGKNLDNIIEINGNLEPIIFMNNLANKIKGDNDNIQIEENKTKLKFKIIYDEEENKEDEEDDNNDDEENDNNDNDNDNDNDDGVDGDGDGEGEGDGGDDNIKKGGCVIQIELYESNDEGYLLRFSKKSGELEDYYKNLKKLYTLVGEII